MASTPRHISFSLHTTSGHRKHPGASVYYIATSMIEELMAGRFARLSLRCLIACFYPASWRSGEGFLASPLLRRAA